MARLRSPVDDFDFRHTPTPADRVCQHHRCLDRADRAHVPLRITQRVTVGGGEDTLPIGFDDLDAPLARIGRTPKTLAGRFEA